MKPKLHATIAGLMTVALFGGGCGEMRTALALKSWQDEMQGRAVDRGPGPMRPKDLNGAELSRIEVGSYFRSAAFSRDGHLAICGTDPISLWDMQTGKKLRDFSEDKKGCASRLAISDDGRMAVSGSYKTVIVWDTSSGKEFRRLDGCSGYIESVSISPGGHRILVASTDGIVHLWDNDIGKELKQLTGHKGKVWSLAFSPNENYAVTGGEDRTLRSWNLDTGEQMKRFDGYGNFDFLSVALSPNGWPVVSGYRSRSSGYVIFLWNSQTGEETRQFRRSIGGRFVTAVAFSNDGRFILSGEYSGLVRLWDANSGKLLHYLEGHIWSIADVGFSADCQRAFSVAGGEDKTISIWDISAWTSTASNVH